MSYHRNLAEEIAALDKVIEDRLKRLELDASPEQSATLNELRQILALKRALLFKLNDELAADAAAQTREARDDSTIKPDPNSQP